jgi:hypothetical protein
LKKRGIALVIVLTVASVVVMMTGAFVMANSANFNSLGASQRQREADLVTESAVQFIYYQLEIDQTFGRAPFKDDNAIPLEGGGMRVEHVPSANFAQLKGVLLDEAGSGREPSFTATLYNHLDQAGTAKSANPFVPADSVLIRVVGRSGSFTSNCDVLYRGEPLFDASITANKLVALSSNNSVNIYSKDRSRNWLRSNGDIHLNGFAYGNGNTELHKDDGGTQGVIWAKGDIFSAGNSKGLEGTKLAEASQAVKGVLAPKSRLNHDIYKLTPEDLTVFKSGETKGAQSWGIMTPGTYSVDLSKVSWFDGDGIQSAYVKTVSYTPPEGVAGDKIVWYDGRKVGEQLILPEGWGVQSYRSDPDGVVRLGGTSDLTPAMTFDFENNAFVADNSSIRVDGDLRITSKLDDVFPTIKLKSDEASSGVIKAVGGSISVQGTLTGGGALVADGDIKLMCNPNTKTGEETNVTADKTAGVVLYGENVNIYGGSNRKVEFKGLIYANNDVNVFGGVKVVTSGGQLTWQGTDDTLDLLSLQGAVVARTGGVNIAQTKDVTLTYDQDYLKKLTKGMPNNRRRIAHLWTRSY